LTGKYTKSFTGDSVNAGTAGALDVSGRAEGSLSLELNLETLE